MNEDTASVTRLFVYGTLMRGESRHDLMDGGVFVESAITEPRFTLVHLGEYPALVDFGSQSVHGEIYMVNTALLLRLDAYEGEAYARQQIKLLQTKPAAAYVWTSTRFDPSTQIQSGDWRKR